MPKGESPPAVFCNLHRKTYISQFLNHFFMLSIKWSGQMPKHIDLVELSESIKDDSDCIGFSPFWQEATEPKTAIAVADRPFIIVDAATLLCTVGTKDSQRFNQSWKSGFLISGVVDRKQNAAKVT